MLQELVTTEVERTALTWPEKARAVVVKDQESYNYAANTLIEIARMEKKIKEHHEPIKTAAFNAHKVAVATEKRFLDPLNEAKIIIKRAIGTWEIEQEKIRADTERKANEETRRLEEEERLRLAVEAEKQGQPEAIVEKIIDTPKPIPITTVAPTFRRVDGVSTRETWHAEVIDIKVLCQAVIDGKAPIESVQANMALLNSMARTNKASLSIPGVRAVKDIGVTARS